MARSACARGTRQPADTERSPGVGVLPCSQSRNCVASAVSSTVRKRPTAQPARRLILRAIPAPGRREAMQRQAHATPAGAPAPCAL